MVKQSINFDRSNLPQSVFNVKTVKQLECKAIDTLGITMYELMLRAGQACYELARAQWPEARHWLIACGHGNNGGDGYVIARLAQAAGINITLLSCNSSSNLVNQEANMARNAWLSAGGMIYDPDIIWPENIDLIIDALLGTGINRAPIAPYNHIINMINAHCAPVLAVDIPSGLMANNGITPGVAVIANHTLSILALKPGQLIGKARDYVGVLHYHDLGLAILLTNIKAPIIRYSEQDLVRWIKPRRSSMHKGDNGRLLLIGGDLGTAGAIRMTAEAALRSGAGLVYVLTHENNVTPILTARPELMVDILNEKLLKKALAWADVIGIGPGLGQRKWGQKALKIVSGNKNKKPMIWDADALNWLARNHDNRQNRIITPHIGEAARLLNVSISEIENDLIYSAKTLAQRYGGVIVLKGAGTVIVSETGNVVIIDVGNAGMATAGMGDILSGIIASFLSQKLKLIEAAYAGCVVHGATADAVCHQRGMRGMLATDLLKLMWQFVNPETRDH
ncbi:YjeF protein [Candidatus Pantoea carbekii]|uniref:Bifunctional NAD(P)H-hydrate repair enzyme n=1 Tax=Candidatus Pantoea carbekii TaxID=1235990 RepID=U3U947_9GAMM|nr:YjeF protein [Candidatus Pantoea carbekii]